MKIKEAKNLQDQRIQEIATEKGIDFNTIQVLLDSVKTKKLLRRNNYHQQTINEIIEKATK